MKDKCGIYCITSKIDNKKYVGKSKCIQSRKRDHFKALRKDTHANRHLQSSYNIYGKDNFIFSIIEECKFDELDTRETYYIIYLNALDDRFGYNTKIESGEFCQHRASTIEYMRSKKVGKPVYGYNKDGELEKEWSSVSLCANELKVNPCDVRRTINQKQRFCRGYVLNDVMEFRLRQNNRLSNYKNFGFRIQNKHLVPGTNYPLLVVA